MKIALIQLNAGSNKADNVAKAAAFVDRAARRGADLVCLPEIFNYRGPVTARQLKKSIAERVPGPSTEPFAALAKKHEIFILAGSVFERSDGRRAYNTSILFDCRGRSLGTYRKRNLFAARLGNRVIREDKNFLAGQKSLAAKVNGFRLGVSICYDLRFAEIYRDYRRQGCDILAVPSAFTYKTGKAHWEILLRARAVENLCYVLGPNQVGVDERGIAAYGSSMVVSPWGEVVARGSTSKEEIVYADILATEIKSARARLPGIV